MPILDSYSPKWFEHLYRPVWLSPDFNCLICRDRARERRAFRGQMCRTEDFLTTPAMEKLTQPEFTLKSGSPLGRVLTPHGTPGFSSQKNRAKRSPSLLGLSRRPDVVAQLNHLAEYLVNARVFKSCTGSTRASARQCSEKSKEKILLFDHMAQNRTTGRKNGSRDKGRSRSRPYHQPHFLTWRLRTDELSLSSRNVLTVRLLFQLERYSLLV